MGERVGHDDNANVRDYAATLEQKLKEQPPLKGKEAPPVAGAHPEAAPKDEFDSDSPPMDETVIQAMPEHANAAKAPERAAAAAAAAPEVIEGSAALETAGTFEPKSILKKGGGKIEVNTAAKDVTTRQAETAKPEDKKPVSVYEKFADKSLAPEEAKKKFDDSANPGFFKDLGSRFKDFNKQSFLEKAKELALPALGIAALVAVSGPLGLMVALGAIGYKMYQSREISKTGDLSDGQRDTLARRLAQGTQQTPDDMRSYIDGSGTGDGKVTLDNVRNSLVIQPIAENAPATVVAVGTAERVVKASDQNADAKQGVTPATALNVSDLKAYAAVAYAEAYAKVFSEKSNAEDADHAGVLAATARAATAAGAAEVASARQGAAVVAGINAARKGVVNVNNNS